MTFAQINRLLTAALAKPGKSLQPIINRISDDEEQALLVQALRDRGLFVPRSLLA